MKFLLKRRDGFIPYGSRSGGLPRPSLARGRRRSLRLAFWFFFLAAFLFFASRFQIFAVKTLVCEDGQTFPGEFPYWCTFLQKELLDHSFFFLDSAGVQRRFLDEYPEFSQLHLQRAFPNRVRARAEARQPLALVVPPWLWTAAATPSAEVLIGKGAYFIGEDGYLFRRTASLSATLPYLYDKGEKPSFWQFSLKVLAGLKKLSLNIVAAEQDEKGLTKLSTEEGLTIYLSPTQEVERQLTVLQLIIEKYKIEGKRLKEIDLRFKEPVVEY